MTKLKRKGKLVEMYNQQAGLCAYCGDKMTLDLGYDKTAEVEHVRPISKGGARKWYNEIAACHECNQSKADKDLLVWWCG